MTGKWDRNFVIYPLVTSEDFQLMISQFYFILYEVDAPLKIRFERFVEKYEKDVDLAEFIEIDDKIKFNDEEYSVKSHAC